MYKSEAAVSPTLADLSRAASTVSTSSSDDASVFRPPLRPLRSFAAPTSRSPARSPARVPAHITKDLAIPDSPEHLRSNDSVPSQPPALTNSPAKSRSRSRNPLTSVGDFEFGDILGEGSFSTVVVGTLKRTGQQYAIKEISKNHIFKHKKESTIMAEKNALVKLSPHPGIVRLHYTFQDTYNLYFVLDLCKNGELQSLVKHVGSLNIPCSRYFTAQVVDALIHMHSKNVIHRDLKPENILITDDFHIKFCDFGTAKILDAYDDRTKTMNVGTAQYVSPEYLEAGQTSRSSDLWALGCVIYQMISGKFTFHGLSDYLIFQKIKKLEYSFPDGFDQDARDLVEKLLVRNPTDRLGAGSPGSDNDMNALKAHPFFTGVDWDHVWSTQPPPLEPGLLRRDQPLHGGTGEEAWKAFISSWDHVMDSAPYPADELEWDSQDRALSGAEADRGVAPSPAAENTIEGGNGVPGVSVTRPPMSRQTTLESSSSGIDGPEGTVVEELARLNVSSREIIAIEEQERGRTKMVTPIQGHGSSSHADLQRFMGQGEQVLFQSFVEVRSLRRRASLLLPRSLPPIKPKIRELVLTTQRIFLLKVRRKPPVGTVIKQEFFFRAADKSKDKSTIVSSAESKGGRDIVLLTQTRSYVFAAEDPSMAAAWIRKINAAISSA